jgi:hypothetical protein
MEIVKICLDRGDLLTLTLMSRIRNADVGGCRRVAVTTTSTGHQRHKGMEGGKVD